MYKCRLIILFVAAIFTLSACVSGGGTPTKTTLCTNGETSCGATESPVVYTATSAEGTLSGLNDLQIAANISSVQPMPFQFVNNSESSQTIIFSVSESPSESGASAMKQASPSSLPVLSVNSCTLNVSTESQPCVISFESNVGVGSWNITPSINGVDLPNIVVQSVPQTAVELGDGVYNFYMDYNGSLCDPEPAVKGTLVIKNKKACLYTESGALSDCSSITLAAIPQLTASECTPNLCYSFNQSVNGNVYSEYSAQSNCPSKIGYSSLTKIK